MSAADGIAVRRPPALLTGAGAIYAVLVFSGVAGLGYQIVWSRMLTIGLGHEVYAVLAIVAAFFAGLAIGAFAFDRPIARSRRPGLWYAGLEAAIGAWTLGLIWLIPAANAAIADWMGPEPSEWRRWAIAMAAPMVLLLPATAAMGATLPAAERLYARLVRDGRGVGGLYAANTAGAMIGALATAVLLAPALGFTATLVVFAVLNFACAAAILFGPARGEAGRPSLPVVPSATQPTRQILALLFVTGLIGIGYEVAVVRALAQVMQNTIYSFAAALSIYLFGAAVGAALYQRVYAQRRGDGLDADAFRWLATLAAAAAALGALAVFAAGDVYEFARAVLGQTVLTSIGGELIGAALTFGPASAVMGALFAHLAQGARGREGGLGAAFAANTLGAAMAPALVGIVMVPALGVVGTMLALALCYLGLAAGEPLGWRRLAVIAVTPALAALVLLGPFDRRLTPTPPGGEIRLHREGVAGTATVVEDAARHRHLRVNGTLVMGGTASYALDRIQGHLALLRHPRPRRALFLGVGTGATLAAAAAHPNLRAEGVELLPEVLATIPEFEAAHTDLGSAGIRISLHVADARRYVRTAEASYDVILADNFHPAKDGAGLLYTREHFEAVRARLSADGVFTQWLPLHQLDLPTLRLIARTFLTVFPDARLGIGNTNLGTPILALYGGRRGGPPALSDVAQRPMPPDLVRALDAVGLDTPFALFGGFLAGPEALAAFAGGGPLNTDDHPRVLFEAPRTVYAPLPPAQERLLHLLGTFEPRPQEAVGLEGAPTGFARRLAAYWDARDAFIRFGAETELTGDLLQDIDVIGPRLLEIVRTSPDFSPAYQPLMRAALALGQVDPKRARALAAALVDAAPGRQDARRLLAQLSRGG